MTQVIARTRRRLSAWLWRRHRLSWQLPSGLHSRVESLSDWVIYNEVFVDRAYDEAIEAALDDAPTDRRLAIVDLGANVGYFSLRVAEGVRQRSGASASILMIEGHPETFATLASRWRRQPLDSRTDVRVVRGLVGARSGKGRLRTGGFTAAAHLSEESGDTELVPFVNLDDVMATDGSIDLLKCDVEGAEADLIAEYPQVWRRVRRAAIEFHPQRVDVDGLVTRLATCGLRQTRIVTATPDGSLRLFAR